MLKYIRSTGHPFQVKREVLDANRESRGVKYLHNQNSVDQKRSKNRIYLARAVSEKCELLNINLSALIVAVVFMSVRPCGVNDK